jgi:hypothetical protein
VRRPELSVTELVTVEHFFVLEGAANNEPVKVHFTDGRLPMTGRTAANGGVAFDDDDLPAGDWVMERVEIGAGPSTSFLIGRAAGSVREHGVHLKLSGGGVPYTLEHRPADSGGFVPIGSYAELQLINANTASRKGHYKQEADLDLLGDRDGDGVFGEAGDQELERLGGNSSFSGIFDGDNKGISNIYMNPGSNNVGLFGVVNRGGAVKNVNIRSGAITGAERVGGIVGLLTAGTIENCATNAAVTGTASSNTRVGGVVGRNEANGVIRKSSNSGAVRAPAYVGGIAGQNTGSARIDECSNTGAVTATTTGDADAGGIVGNNLAGGVISNCSNSGPIRGDARIGGVAGYNPGSITNCFNKGNVGGSGTAIAGIAGANYGTISGCYNDGDVVSEQYIVGGIAGANYSGITASFNRGSITGDHKVGGIAGHNNTIDSYSGRITACYNTGVISSFNNPGNVGNAGGVAGQNDRAIIACYSTEKVLGTINTGVLVGRNSGTITASYFKQGTAASGVGSGAGTATSFDDVFTPTGSAAWGTGTTGATNGWWKPGTTNGSTLPKLWFE